MSAPARERRKRKATATPASPDSEGEEDASPPHPPRQAGPSAHPHDDGHGSAEVATGDSIHLAPGFITKTFAMVTDKGNAAAIKWGADGTSIVIGQVGAWLRSALGGGA